MMVPRPLKPWKATPKQLLPDVFGAIGTVIASLILVLVSPLAGILGFILTFIVLSLFIAASISWIRKDRKAAANSVSTIIIYFLAAFVLLPVASIVFEIIRKGAPGLSIGMFFDDMSVTASDAPLSEGGLLHALVGSLYVVALATIVSIPIGLLTALYLTEVKGKASGTVRFFVQAMSGVPSIVAGLFIYAVWMISLGGSYNTAAGSLALAILMIPTVARTAEEVLKLIPTDLREAGLALGATQWKTVALVVIPAARSGLITAVILGTARVAGETAPLLLTVGGNDAMNWNPFSGNNSALPFYVWKNFGLGTETGAERAWTGIFVLMVVVMIFFTIARVLGNKKG
ncbi:MAG: phosphate ABC transporter permease PstA [Actinobacteria bacterium]|nr:phosphate ABC transporter permease PstA [Actinomycetota bacterium]MSZ12783.1 phosphate ABC transporter permease PstA [Actinomycetota bacterium]MSZ27954.1 phosphate ABC transporter permease PstA [Actinomycetota bacterium]MSZ34880.1 phosphate ABC transporter permease PstA [Actinomycetota bacterium]